MNLFVYGTLAPGEPNEHVLKPLNGTWQRGTIKGQLFESGWGAALGYPGIVLSEEGDHVKGQLFTSPDLEGFWQTLDEFEGEGYQRVLTPVLLDNGETVDAFTYELSELGKNE